MTAREHWSMLLHVLVTSHSGLTVTSWALPRRLAADRVLATLIFP